MIHLLTPDDTKRGAALAKNDQAARIRDMGIEETRLVNSINSLRAEEKHATQEHDDRIQKMRNEYAAEKCELEIDIKGLQQTRKDLMAPIDEVRKEADERNEKSKQREDAVAKREIAMTEAEERHTERLETLNDREQLQDERDEALDERERHVEDAENRTKASAVALAEKWVEYHAAVDANNKAFIDRENAVSARENAANTRSIELDKREQNIRKLDREVADRRMTLQAAFFELEQREKAVAAKEAPLNEK